MKINTLLFVLAFGLFSCEFRSGTPEEKVTRTGETVGKGTSDFIKGVSKGVSNTVQSKLEFSDALKAKGLQTGKFQIERSKTGKRSVLSVYLIFDQDFKKKVSVKVYDANGQEYGRISQLIEGKKGDARFYDFAFDPRTNLENRSRFTFE